MENISIIGIAVILGLALGYLIALVKTSKAQQDQACQIESLQQTVAQNEELQASVDELKSQQHTHELEARQLQQSLRYAEDTLADREQRLARTSEQLEEVRELKIKADSDARAHSVRLQELTEKIEQRQSEFSGLQSKYDGLSKQHYELSEAHAELKTSQVERDRHHRTQLEQLDEQKAVLKKEFENLANEIFDKKGKALTETSQSSLGQMLKPFREQIEQFQSRINEVHTQSVKENTNLNAEIKKVLDIGLKMSDDAKNLTSALKGDSQQRGVWGEAQLKRTLEMSGLIEDAHYETQSGFKDQDGKHKQVDYLIKLPDDKHIIIDSKVSLNAYDGTISAETPEAYKHAMDAHVNAVKKHIDDLASKDYSNLVGVRSPSFVLMFMPIEPAYIEALKSKKDLFRYGYDKGVVLVSHTTLIPIMRTVANLWMMEQSNSEAREISEKAGDIYNQVCVVAERLDKLGGTLSTVSNHYNSTVRALVGQQGLHGKVERFNQLSSKVNRTMPNVEPKHIDFENERLGIVVQEVETEAFLENKKTDSD